MAAGTDPVLTGPGGGVVGVAAHDIRGGSMRWLAMLLVLAAGWGALFSYSVLFLAEDLPLRQTAPRPLSGPIPVDSATFAMPPELMRPSGLPRPEARAPEAAPMPAPRLVLAGTNSGAVPEAAVPLAAAPASSPIERPDYIGIWGPTGAACGARSRRRGYLPATITADGARAGRTICSFYDRTRSGNAWVMGAECSDRGRRWSSQVRLHVDGDRLTWSSGKGTSSYLRCSRRAG
ncbi:peptidase inhibitor family I36 protein [Methylobacterium segetis]|uniref:peptidase inhibitor family I36 protein n=1 Tax=Methylobacterium segetis TaxID=2488750 RepID=UPI001FDFC015|nr:peptidase inhibitor family I36 protein [Methylobacterium segetis]